MLLLFACLTLLSLATLSILLLRHSFTGIRAYVVRILMQPEDQQLLGILKGSSNRVSAASLTDGATTRFLAFIPGDSHFWTTQDTSVSYINKSPLHILYYTYIHATSCVPVENPD